MDIQFFFFFNLFIFLAVFVAARGLFLDAASRGTFHCSVRACHCGDSSCCGAQAVSV